jgi:hypothetical protein
MANPVTEDFLRDRFWKNRWKPIRLIFPILNHRTIRHGMCELAFSDFSVGILDGPGIKTRWEARFSAPVQTGPGAHTVSCIMGTGYFPGVKSGLGVTLNPHHF